MLLCYDRIFFTNIFINFKCICLHVIWIGRTVIIYVYSMCVRACVHYCNIFICSFFFFFVFFSLQDFVILTNFKQIAQLSSTCFLSCSRSFALFLFFVLSLFIIYRVMFSPNINSLWDGYLPTNIFMPLCSIVTCRKCIVESLECVDFFLCFGM